MYWCHCTQLHTSRNRYFSSIEVPLSLLLLILVQWDLYMKNEININPMRIILHTELIEISCGTLHMTEDCIILCIDYYMNVRFLIWNFALCKSNSNSRYSPIWWWRRWGKHERTALTRKLLLHTLWTENNIKILAIHPLFTKTVFSAGSSLEQRRPWAFRLERTELLIVCK